MLTSELSFAISPWPPSSMSAPTDYTLTTIASAKTVEGTDGTSEGKQTSRQAKPPNPLEPEKINSPEGISIKVRNKTNKEPRKIPDRTEFNKQDKGKSQKSGQVFFQ